MMGGEAFVGGGGEGCTDWYEGGGHRRGGLRI